MTQWTCYGLGVLARLLSTLAGHYSAWHAWRAGDASDDLSFMDDLRAFGTWLLNRIVSWFLGRSDDGFVDQWQPDPYR